MEGDQITRTCNNKKCNRTGVIRLFVLILLLGSVALVYADVVRRVNENRKVLASGIIFASNSIPEPNSRSYNYVELPRGFAGSMLSANFAQSKHDWDMASFYIERALLYDPDSLELLERSMILAAGAGNIDIAAKRAKEVLAAGGGDTGLPLIILAVYAFSQDDFKKVDDYLADLSGKGNVSDFVSPLLSGWSKAAQGATREEIFQEDFIDISVHAFHGALISVYIDDRDTAKIYADKMMQLSGLSEYEGERIADMLLVLGEYEGALGLYKGLQIHDGNLMKHEKSRLENKISAIQDKGPELEKIIDSLKIKSPAHGAAWVMHDMASILYQDGSSASTDLFSNLALTLNPDLAEVRVFLASTASDNGRKDDAVDHYMSIPGDHALYMEARRQAAFLVAEQGDLDRAKVILKDLFKKHKNIDVLIQLGDIYRQVEDYTSALEYYNRAAGYLKNDISEDNWYLLYVRGMVYEREGQWNKAEADLQAALGYRPEHPYLLNYLGYGWADQGTNLDRSLELIEKAVSILPADGYITDSLGWVHYMMGNCEKAIPYLEKSSELMPYDAVINDHLGDIYWCMGRRQEARFQWSRAFNNTDDPELIKSVSEKLERGLPDVDVRKAHK